MRINTKELYEITERTFNEYKSKVKDVFGIEKDVAGFNVDIATVNYSVRIQKGIDELYIVKVYSRNDNLLKMINIEPNYNGFEHNQSKWFGVYIQCLFTFGQIKMY